MSNMTFKTTVDVRTLPLQQRHSMILYNFNNLALGEAMLLVNDHDPESLHSQFKAELGDTFIWNHIEQGPQIWKVRINRISTCNT